MRQSGICAIYKNWGKDEVKQGKRKIHRSWQWKPIALQIQQPGEEVQLSAIPGHYNDIPANLNTYFVKQITFFVPPPKNTSKIADDLFELARNRNSFSIPWQRHTAAETIHLYSPRQASMNSWESTYRPLLHNMKTPSGQFVPGFVGVCAGDTE